MKILSYITGSFSSVFGGIFGFIFSAFDKASRFDKNETEMLMKSMKNYDVKFYERTRYGSKIIREYQKEVSQDAPASNNF